MSDRRHLRAQELFDAACELPPDRRAAFLTEQCADDADLARLVSDLLRIEESGSARLDQQLAAPSVADWAASAAPQRIGAYRVLHRIGSGGMGVVYEAEQPGLERHVALKVLRAELVSESMLRRFESEARILARLTHPGIARILEVGAADLGQGTQPYFAMELVEGEPLIEFAKRNGLSTSARLQLLAKVCDAVQHAHGKGVIHRDLKPSNILVDASGEPKVLDFGVARVTDSERELSTVLTRTGELLGTLAYMSPEQLAGDPDAVDTRSDVYALGVLAYELLAGERPFDVGQLALAEAVRVLSQDEPSRLGRLRREFAGDVETIVGKALEKDPERRYRSTEELVSDIRRYLANQPIGARPPSVGYQLRKYARRNRALVAGASAVFLTLVIGIFSTSRMYLRAEDARAAERERRAEAEEAADVLRATNDTFLGLLRSPTPWEMGAEVSMRDVLAAASERARAAFVGQPLQRAALFETLGATHEQLGLHAEASQFFRDALELLPSDPLAKALLLGRLANAYRGDGEFTRAESALEEAERLLDPLERSVALSARRRLNVTRVRLDLDTGRPDHAEELAREELGRLESEASSAEDRCGVRELVARAIQAQGDVREAERLTRVSLEELDAAGLGDSADAQLTLNTLASMLHAQQRNREAVPILERVLETSRRQAGARHPIVATQIGNLATVLRGIGEDDRAEQLYREGLEISRATRTAPHFDIAGKLGNLGSLLVARGKLDEGLEMLREADGMLVELFGERSLHRASLQTYLGVAERRAGQLDVAREHFELALSLMRELSPSEGPELAYLFAEFAQLELDAARPRQAAERFHDAHELRARVSGKRSLGALFVARQEALALCEAGDFERGVALSEEALQTVLDEHPDHARAVAQHRADHGWCLWLAGRREEAAPYFEGSIEALAAAFGEDSGVVRAQRKRLASAQ